MSSSVSELHDLSSKAESDTSWMQNERHVIPKNRLGIVLFGLMCSIFLAAIDQTIVSTALPTIVADLGGGNKYGWVGSAYMLASASLGPLYGKISDIIGRKPVLYASIILFLVGSALCGAAQDMTWLVVCRAVQGIGGGGIIQLVQITISDIVPLKDRGKYAGAIGTTWGIAGVIGPLLGGVLTDRASWRWCFWINLPTGAVSGAILYFFLNLNPHQGKPFYDHVKEFDFVGLAAAVSGVLCLLLGFNSSETTWDSAETISLLVTGVVLLLIFGINELYTKRSPIIPPRLFKTRTTAFVFVSIFLHAVMFFTGSYYLPMYYQVLGASAISSGIKMLPYSLASSLQSTVAGWIVARTGSYRPVMWSAWVVMTLGWGLMITLDNTSSIAIQEVYPLIAALGVGCLFQTPIIAVQAAMPLKDMATSTGALIFARMLGGTIGITIGETIISSQLEQRLRGIPGVNISISAASINDSIRNISSIPDASLKTQVMHAYSRSISMVWLVNTPLSGFGLVLMLFVRAYSLQQEVVQGHDDTENANDVEKGEVVVNETDPSST